MKYKVGDRVRVRSDLKNDVGYGSRHTVKEMMDYKGNVVTISEVHTNCYWIEEDKKAWDWTDEMLEGLAEGELTAEEAIRLRAEMCANNYCNECRSSKRNNGEGIDCCEFSQKYPEQVIEILKQWKKEHEKKEVEKKEVETEFACIVRAIEDLGDSKRCVYEEDLAGVKGETFRMAMERVLKEYCKEHEGKFFAVYEEICRVKE